ncbi:hypothetical protein HKBW3S03_01927, partial [Candidatus Hakubella thermalkaliphila]
NYFIKNYYDGVIPDYQAAAFFNGYLFSRDG